MKDKRYTILAVDDDVTLLKMISQMLQDDYEVITCSNPDEIESQMKNFHVDLILLDIVMAEQTGFETCQELRKKYTKDQLPILFVTSQKKMDCLAKGFELGANDYITKPIRISDLKMSISSNLLESAILLNNDGVPVTQQEETPPKVMIMGDNQVICESIRKQMAMLDIEVTLFNNPDLALRHFGKQHEQIDAVITEVNHKSINGYRFYEYLQQINQDLNNFFIVSSSNKSQHPELFKKYKNKPHFFSPIPIAKLIEQILDLIEEKDKKKAGASLKAV